MISTDVFIKHFTDTYSDPYPPVWIVSELLSIGRLSILYHIAKRSAPRKAVAKYLDLLIKYYFEQFLSFHKI